MAKLSWSSLLSRGEASPNCFSPSALGFFASMVGGVEEVSTGVQKVGGAAKIKVAQALIRRTTGAA